MNLSDFYELLAVAARWHVAHTGTNLPEDGYTLMFEKEAQGWFETLPDPAEYPPGMVALHPLREQARAINSSTNQWVPIEFEELESNSTDESDMACYAAGRLPEFLARRFREIEIAADLEPGSFFASRMNTDLWNPRETELEGIIFYEWSIDTEEGRSKAAPALESLKEKWRQEDGGEELTFAEREEYRQDIAATISRYASSTEVSA